ncbi:hypothetical protein KI387_036134, partial [Taxus chinensis]
NKSPRQQHELPVGNIKKFPRHGERGKGGASTKRTRQGAQDREVPEEPVTAKRERTQLSRIICMRSGTQADKCRVSNKTIMRVTGSQGKNQDGAWTIACADKNTECECGSNICIEEQILRDDPERPA